MLLHDLWPVVDGEDNVGDAGIDEGLDLVDDHGLVTELDEGLGEGEGLRSVSVMGCEGAVSCQRTRGRRRVPKPPTRMSPAEN